MGGGDVLLDASAEVCAAHARHHHVAHHDVGHLAFRQHGSLNAVPGRDDLIIYTSQLAHEEETEVVVVLHHEDTLILFPSRLRSRSVGWSALVGCFFLLRLRLWLQVSGEVYDEARPLPQLAFQRNGAPVQLDILLYHVQSDARACLLRPRILFRPIEPLEHVALRLGGDAAPRVCHCDASVASAVCQVFFQGDAYAAPGLRKLEGVGEEVGQYLSHLVAVEVHEEAARPVFEGEADALLLRQRCELHRGVPDELVQIAAGQFQPFTVHLHLAEVEQLVYQLQQVAGTLAHVA